MNAPQREEQWDNQTILAKLDRLTPRQKAEVLDFVGYLLSKRERPAAEPAQERDLEQNPLLQLIGTAEVDPFAHEIDDALYGA